MPGNAAGMWAFLLFTSWFSELGTQTGRNDPVKVSDPFKDPALVALVRLGAFWRLWFAHRPQAACFHQESPPEGNLSAQTLHITPITKNTLSSALYLTGSVAFSGGPHAAAEGVFCHLPVVGGSPQLRDIRHPADSSSVLPDSPPRLRCGVRAKVVLLHLFCSLCDNAGGGHQRGLEYSEEATANKAAAAPDEETGS